MAISGECREAEVGRAPAGKPVTPGHLPARADRPEKSQPAPAPGVPVPPEEYDRLKEEAEEAPAPNDAPAQED